MKSSKGFKLEPTKYKSVYKIVGKKDTTYYIRYRIGEKVETEKVGKKGEGFTEKEALDILYDRQRSSIVKKPEKFQTNLSFQELSSKYFEKLLVEALAEEDLPIEQKKAKLAVNIKKEKSIYKSFWSQWPLRTRPLGTISEQNVTDYLKIQRETYSLKTIYNALTLAKSIMKHTKDYHGQHNPFIFENTILKETYKRPRQSREQFLNSTEVYLLLEYLKSESSFQNYTLVLTSLLTGARPNSVLNLKVKDINFKKKEINIFDFKRKMFYRSILTKELEEVLKRKIDTKSMESYIFHSDKNGDNKLSEYPRSINRVLDKLFNDGKEKTEERIVPYTFRHTFANLLLFDRKAQILTVSKLLNHASIKTTIDHYITFDKEYAREDLKALELSFNNYYGDISISSKLEKAINNLAIEETQKKELKDLIAQLGNS